MDPNKPSPTHCVAPWCNQPIPNGSGKHYHDERCRKRASKERGKKRKLGELVCQLIESDRTPADRSRFELGLMNFTREEDLGIRLLADKVLDELFGSDVGAGSCDNG